MDPNNPFAQFANPQAQQGAPSAPAPSSAAPPATSATTPAQPPSAEPTSRLHVGNIVTHTYTDERTGEKHTTYGVVVEALAPFTDVDGSEAVERACVAWFHGVSGPIEATDLETV